MNFENIYYFSNGGLTLNKHAKNTVDKPIKMTANLFFFNEMLTFKRILLSFKVIVAILAKCFDMATV